MLRVVDGFGIGLVPLRWRPMWAMTAPVSLGRCTSPQSCRWMRRARVQNNALAPAPVNVNAAPDSAIWLGALTFER